MALIFFLFARFCSVTTNQLYGLWTYALNCAPVAWIGGLITIIEIRVVWGDEVPIYMYAILLVLMRVLVVVMEVCLLLCLFLLF